MPTPSGPKGSHLHDHIGQGVTSTDASPKRALDVNIAAADVALGGGTQYTEGDTDATLVGTIMMAENALSPDEARPLQVDNDDYLKVNIAAGDLAPGLNVVVTNEVEVKNTSGVPLSVEVNNATLDVVSEKSATATKTATTVSTSAVQILAGNPSRNGFLVTNNETNAVYIGYDNTVTTSGATVGHMLTRGGSWQQLGDAAYTGAIYAICGAVIASQNVVVTEFT